MIIVDSTVKKDMHSAAILTRRIYLVFISNSVILQVFSIFISQHVAEVPKKKKHSEQWRSCPIPTGNELTNFKFQQNPMKFQRTKS